MGREDRKLMLLTMAETTEQNVDSMITRLRVRIMLFCMRNLCNFEMTLEGAAINHRKVSGRVRVGAGQDTRKSG